MLRLESMRKLLVSYLVGLLLALALLVPTIQSARAEWVMLPENTHQLYETYALYFDEQTQAVNYGNARLWIALGATLPIYGNPDIPSHPEFYFHASANAALHYNDNYRIFTETIDARAGFGFEFMLNESMRLNFGLTHNSGHAVDGLDANDIDLTGGPRDLFQPTLGQEYVYARFIYDLDNTFRFGGTFKPFIRSVPQLQTLAFDEFIEYFPFGAIDNPHHGNPFVALGFDEWGPNNLVLTTHVQLGLYYGNHFSKTFHQTMRAVIGYYTGADPRLKYFEFRDARQSFAYLGFMFSI